MKESTTISNTIITSTGAPQGSVLSPILFTTYTNDSQISSDNVHLIKFADDTTIQGLLSSTCNDDEFLEAVSGFVKWCDDHHLHLNIKKTKEMIIDFRKKKPQIEPLYIKNECVDRVKSYKYLGVTIDDQLDWHEHLPNVYKKVNSRLYFLRKLKSFHVDNTLIKLFYKATIESITSFCLICWGGNSRKNEINKINRDIIKSEKICANSFLHLEEMYVYQCQTKLKNIIKDHTHPLHHLIISNERSGRIRHICCRTERYYKSFLPHAIRVSPTI